jgi:hypothetical protein
MSIIPVLRPVDPPDVPKTSGLLLDESVLLTLTDPVERARTANEIAGRLQLAVQFVLQVRRDALREAANRGTPRPELARHIGVTASRVGQLLAEGRRAAARTRHTNTVGVAR